MIEPESSAQGDRNEGSLHAQRTPGEIAHDDSRKSPISVQSSAQAGASAGKWAPLVSTRSRLGPGTASYAGRLMAVGVQVSAPGWTRSNGQERARSGCAERYWRAARPLLDKQR